jgi:predicted small metal-binding protein
MASRRSTRREDKLGVDAPDAERPATEKGDKMAYSVQCKDAGMDCPGSFTTETKEELMKHVELHAKEAHPDVDLSTVDLDQLVKTTA